MMFREVQDPNHVCRRRRCDYKESILAIKGRGEGGGKEAE